MYIPSYFNLGGLLSSNNVYNRIPDNLNNGIISLRTKIIAILKTHQEGILQTILLKLEPTNKLNLYNLTVPDEVNINFKTNIDNNNKDIIIYKETITKLNNIMTDLNRQQNTDEFDYFGKDFGKGGSHHYDNGSQYYDNGSVFTNDSTISLNEALNDLININNYIDIYFIYHYIFIIYITNIFNTHNIYFPYRINMNYLHQNISNYFYPLDHANLAISRDDKQYMENLLLKKLMDTVNTIIQSGWTDLLNLVLKPLTENENAINKINRNTDISIITKNYNY